MKPIAPLFLIAITLLLASACSDENNSADLLTTQLTSTDKEQRLEFGCRLIVTETTIDGVLMNEQTLGGTLGEDLVIQPEVDFETIIRVTQINFGKNITSVISAPSFVSLNRFGQDEDDNDLLGFRSDESFIYRGGVRNRNGKISYCTIGIIVRDEIE